MFGQAWADTDRNGCDTRNDVLRRDLTDVVLRPGTSGCVVSSGRLCDPYSGRDIAFVRVEATSQAVQIDHVVALSDAWRKGAQQWTPQRRAAFAIDPLNLLAVDGSLNAQKSDGDAATWLPPDRSYCPQEPAPPTVPASPATSPSPGAACDPTYPTVCVHPVSAAGDLDCGDIPHRRFVVLPADPHRFDGDGNGVGCEE